VPLVTAAEPSRPAAAAPDDPPPHFSRFAESQALRVDAAGLDGRWLDLVAPIAPRVHLCYEDGRRAQADLEGELSLSLAADGGLALRAAVKAEKAELPHGFVACVRTAFERVALPKGSTGRAELTLRFSSAGGEPGDTRRALLDDASAYGSMRRERAASDLPADVQFIIRRNFDRIHRCYLEGLASDPKLTGTLRVSFEIGADGLVSAARADGTIADERVRACAATTFASLLFPGRSGASLRATRSFTFAPQ